MGCRLILVEDIVIALATDNELASGVGSREEQRPLGDALPSWPALFDSERRASDRVQMNLDGALGYLQLPPDLLVRQPPRLQDVRFGVGARSALARKTSRHSTSSLRGHLAIRHPGS